MSGDNGALLGEDFGSKRVGPAVTDPERRVAVVLKMIEGKSGRELARAIKAVADEKGCGTIVIGHPAPDEPVPVSHGFSEVIAGIERLTGNLRGMGFTVVLWDESFTTATALNDRRKVGGKGAHRSKWIDSSAATLLLRDYLDHAAKERNYTGNL